MLMTDDPQLGTVFSTLGKVTFIQIVGVTTDELKAAQQWNVNGMIELMKRIPEAGGDFLVTDMQRSQSIFKRNHEIQQAVERGITNEGSNLSGISAKCTFKRKISLEDLSPSDEDNTSSIENLDDEDEEDEEFFDDETSDSENSSSIDEREEEAIKNDENAKLIKESKENDEINVLENNLSKITIAKDDQRPETDQPERDQPVDPNMENNKNKNDVEASKETATTANNEQQQIVSPMSVTHENPNNCSSSMSYNSETGVNEPANNFEIKYLKEVHIFLNLEAGLLLPLVLR